MGINRPFVSPITLGPDTGRVGDASYDLAIYQRAAGLMSMHFSAARGSDDGCDCNRLAATVLWRMYPAMLSAYVLNLTQSKSVLSKSVMSTFLVACFIEKSRH